MPYQINQISPRKFEVVNTKTGTIHSKGTSKKKAEAQLRLLDNLEKKTMKPTRAKVKGEGNPFSRQVAPAPAPAPPTAIPVNLPTPRATRTVAQIVPDPFSQPEVQVVIPPTPVFANHLSTFTLEQLIQRQEKLVKDRQNTDEEINLIDSQIRNLESVSNLRKDEKTYLRTLKRRKKWLRSQRGEMIFELSGLVNEIDNRISMNTAEVPVATPIGGGLKDTVVGLFKGRSKYSPAIQSILKKHGDIKIRGAIIKRTPVPSLITQALGTISPEFAKRLKESPYDKLFHLFLVLQLENGKVVVVEKNETLSVTDRYKKRGKEEEEKQVSVPQGLTLNTALEKTQQSMGTEKFFGYSAKDNNCQDFLVAFLKANNMGNEEVFKFVKQDTAYLFKNLPILRKISNTLTDIAGRANVALEGTGNTVGVIQPTVKEKLSAFKERVKSLEGIRQIYWNENKQDILEIINEEIQDLEKQIKNIEQKRYVEACDRVREELDYIGEDKRPEGFKPIPDGRGLGGAGKPKIQKGSQEALEWCKKMREAKMAKNKK